MSEVTGLLRHKLSERERLKSRYTLGEIVALHHVSRLSCRDFVDLLYALVDEAYCSRLPDGYIAAQDGQGEAIGAEDKGKATPGDE